MNKIILIVLAMVGIMTPHWVSAQDTSRAPYLKAMLVQLSSEQNRLAHFKKRGDTRTLARVQYEAEEVRKKMIADFTDHFHVCPVYYYMDTNIIQIRNKQFAGVLLDSNLQPVTHAVIDGHSSDYAVVYYGYINAQPSGTKPKADSSNLLYEPERLNGKGVTVLNARMEQLGYFYWLKWPVLYGKKKKKFGKYYFESKRFDLDYYPFARSLHVAFSQCGSEDEVPKWILHHQ